MSHGLRASLGIALMMVLTLASQSAVAAEHQGGSPNLWLIAIGVADYRAGELSLQYAEDDMRALNRWAKEQQGRYFSEVETEVLVNGDSRRENIMPALSRMLRRASSGDLVVVAFSGHGVMVGDEYYFLPWETDPDNIEGTGISYAEMLSKLQIASENGADVLVLVDTCHGGALGEALLDGHAGKGIQLKSGLPSAREGSLTGEGLWALFSAGSATDVAFEGPEYRHEFEEDDIEGHGLFIYAVLGALMTNTADRDEDALVERSELESYVHRTVASLSKGLQVPQITGRLTDPPLSWVPDTPEFCNGRDDDFDSSVDEGFPDQNGDGIADCMEPEMCDGRDNDLDGRTDEGFDVDGDFYFSLDRCGEARGGDCDDHNPEVHPGREDIGNMVDDDCDGILDEDGVDGNGNGIPDSLEGARRGARLGIALSSAAVTAGTAVLLYSTQQLGQFESPDCTADPACGEVSTEDVVSYRRWSLATVGGALGAGLAIGLSVNFGLEGRKLSVQIAQVLEIGGAWRTSQLPAFADSPM